MEGYRSPYGPGDDFGYKRGENALGFDEAEGALWNKARSEDDRFAIMKQRDERRLKEHQEREKQEWPTTRAGQLLKKLGESFAEYKAAVGRAGRRECVGRNIAICTRCWKRRVRRRSVCRT